jgi:hypothetical protein
MIVIFAMLRLEFGSVKVSKGQVRLAEARGRRTCRGNRDGTTNDGVAQTTDRPQCNIFTKNGAEKQNIQAEQWLTG